MPTADSTNLVIVRLVGLHDILTITTGPIVPLYTVTDAAGRVLVSDVTMSELKKTRPDLYQQIAHDASASLDAWAGD